MVAAPLRPSIFRSTLPSSTATPQKKPDKPTYVTIQAGLDAGDRTRLVNGSIMPVSLMHDDAMITSAIGRR